MPKGNKYTYSKHDVKMSMCLICGKRMTGRNPIKYLNLHMKMTHKIDNPKTINEAVFVDDIDGNMKVQM